MFSNCLLGPIGLHLLHSLRHRFGTGLPVARCQQGILSEDVSNVYIVSIFALDDIAHFLNQETVLPIDFTSSDLFLELLLCIIPNGSCDTVVPRFPLRVSFTEELLHGRFGFNDHPLVPLSVLLLPLLLKTLLGMNMHLSVHNCK